MRQKRNKILTLRLCILLSLFVGATLLRVAFFLHWTRVDGGRSFSWLLNPFRQSLESVEGKPRTEFGCYGSNGQFHWTALDAKLVESIETNHHIKVLQYALWSGSATRGNYVERAESLKRFFCEASSLNLVAQCTSSNEVVILRNRNILGQVVRDEPYNCN